jgi:hypothetical protein
MGIRFLITLLFTIHYSAFTLLAQDVPETSEQKLENLADILETETEDDSYLLELERFRKNPINLNHTDADELRELRILSGLQISHFISYRKLFGKFLSIYELQAIPSWDIITIRRLLPFVSIGSSISVKDEAKKRFTGGEHTLLLRFSRILETQRGYDKSRPGTKYQGGPERILFRYRYTYKNLLQFGIVGDKDAGEQFFRGAQKKGFDFYSFHLFARRIGIVQALALGDFTVNLGQGLIHWQSLAFGKSSEAISIKRQSATLRPYNSAGEFNFHRGAGITIAKGKTEATAFISFRKLSANFVADTVDQYDYISSFLTSGYHRTPSEIADRNILSQTAAGANVKYRTGRLLVSANGIWHRFSLPVQKRSEPYNYYAISGNQWFNFSMDYSYTFKNIHFFGEAAADKNLNKAFVNGLLLSVDNRVDLALLQRTISQGFQSINGNAFTENTFPTNETGWYAGISIRPAMAWRIDAYADFFRFPWLKYLVDAPSRGTEYLSQVTYTPGRNTELYLRYRHENKERNQPGNVTVTNFLVYKPRQNIRLQFRNRINPSVTLRSRVELMSFDKQGINKSNGFLTYFDIIYKPMLKPLSGNIRLQYFETDNYDSRIYAYENDVLFSYSIPPFYDKGFRYYINLNYDISRRLTCWLRWAQTIYPERKTVGSGLDEIQGNRRSEIKLQAYWKL